MWTTDEGLNGVAVHVANDRSEPLTARLRVAAYRDGEHCIEDGAVDLDLAARGTATHDAEAILGRFVDLSYAYRFGPPGHDTVVATLESREGDALSQAFRFPAGRPLERHSAGDLGLDAVLSADGAALTVTAGRLVYGLRIDAPGRVPADDACSIEPGHARTIALHPALGAGGPVSITALNLDGSLAARVEDHLR